MAATRCEKPSPLGPYKPTLILHGGAGSISRASLPPDLYARYHASLLAYLTETRKLLASGASALDAACYAVTRFEDDPLFNCGRGAVFTEQGTIEMEASVMVSSVDPVGPLVGGIKRGAAVSLVRNTRHPILLAKEVLVAADADGGSGGTSSMHCHLSGRDVEEWGWKERDLEKKPDQWFWTRKRWEEHRRGRHQSSSYTYDDLLASIAPLSPHSSDEEGVAPHDIPSQGTVGAVCLDSHGNLAVATSTGGLTNKKAGRIGDTPTIGSGFWAESWEENALESSAGVERRVHLSTRKPYGQPFIDSAWTQAGNFLGSCFDVWEAETPRASRGEDRPPAYTAMPTTMSRHYHSPDPLLYHSVSTHRKRRRAVAMSGTGNGDSFLRTNATRTAASLCRYSLTTSLADAVTAIAGPNGELQQSAADRWGVTGEGQGGIIGIEVTDDDDVDVDLTAAHTQDWETRKDGKSTIAYPVRNEGKKRGKAVFDFNCGGLFRAYYEVNGDAGEEEPMVMVFKDAY